jgi:hypothetical protein
VARCNRYRREAHSAAPGLGRDADPLSATTSRSLPRPEMRANWRPRVERAAAATPVSGSAPALTGGRPVVAAAAAAAEMVTRPSPNSGGRARTHVSGWEEDEARRRWRCRRSLRPELHFTRVTRDPRSGLFLRALDYL